MRERPRVGVLIASLRGGGAERVALGLRSDLESAGFTAHLLTLDRNHDLLSNDPESGGGATHDCIRLTGADVEWPTLLKIIFFPWQWLQLVLAIRRLKLDIVISLMERSNIASLLAPCGHRRIVSIHSYPETLLASKDALKRGLVRRAYSWLLSRADKIVLVSKEAAENFHQLFSVGPDQTRVIYNACDIDRLQSLAAEPLPEACRNSLAPRFVCAAGSLRPVKGYRQLIRAFADVVQTLPDLQLVILGEGPLLEDLQRLSRDLDIDEKVLFPGFLPNPMPWISRADLFVLSSLREGLPGVLLEAMALSVPIVSTDCRSGPRELLSSGSSPGGQPLETIEQTPCGLLTPPPGPKAPGNYDPLSRPERLLAEAMLRMLNDHSLSASCVKQAGVRVGAFSPGAILREWRSLIEEVSPNYS